MAHDAGKLRPDARPTDRPDDTPEAVPVEHAPSVFGRDLPLRVASGLAIGAVALVLLYLGPVPFAVFIGVVGLVASWEWSRMVRSSSFDAILVVHALAVALAAALAGWGLAALGLVAVAVGTILTGLLAFGQRPLLSAVGVAYAGLPAVALLWLCDDFPLGTSAVLFLLIVVALADTGAFLGGRLIGGPRLWPRISPNKTWAGLASGVAASGLAGAVFAHVIGADVVVLSASGALLGAIAQCGDLAESALKRHFGVKDASALIPGHGGVLDRIDGLVFAAIAAGIAALAINPHAPASALIFGG